MNKCLNCDNPVSNDKVFCDELCHQGFTNIQYKKFDKEFRSRLGY